MYRALENDLALWDCPPSISGYIVARKKVDILLAPEAIDDLRGLKANIRVATLDAIEEHLRHEPTKISKSRVKRLRGLSRPQYRLRVEDIRVFYDVSENTVEILAIVPKDEAEAWLENAGEPHEDSSSE